MRVTVCRKAHFNAAHRLYVKSWDDAKNEKVLESAPILISTDTAMS